MACWLIGLGLVSLAGIAGAVALQALLSPGSTPEIRGTYLEDGRPMADFELITSSGEPFTTGDLEGQWTLLAFGAPSAQAEARETIALLERVHALLAQTHHGDRLQSAWISVEPPEEPRQRLAPLKASGHETLHLLTGEPSVVGPLAHSLGVRYSQGASGVVVQPADVLFVIAPDGKLLALLLPPQHPELIAQDLFTLMEHRASPLSRIIPGL